MQSKALTRSATDITDEQCQLYTTAGLRVRRELKAGQVRKLVSTGRGWVSDWTGKVPAKKDFYHGGKLCAGYRVTRATAHAWCRMKQAATKSWRRDLQVAVSSLVSGGIGRTTISVHAAFSTGRVLVGRGHEQHLKYFWGGVKAKIPKTNRRIEESIGERLFRQRSCLPELATEHKW